MALLMDCRKLDRCDGEGGFDFNPSEDLQSHVAVGTESSAGSPQATGSSWHGMRSPRAYSLSLEGVRGEACEGNRFRSITMSVVTSMLAFFMNESFGKRMASSKSAC